MSFHLGLCGITTRGPKRPKAKRSRALCQGCGGDLVTRAPKAIKRRVSKRHTILYVPLCRTCQTS